MKEKCTYKLKFLLAMMASLALSSCTEYSKLTKSDDVDLKYDKAFEYYEKGEYYKAATLLESVIPSYRGTEKGETGLYTKAMAHFNNKEYLTAKSYFSGYCKGYPSGKYIEDAKFHIGYCYYLETASFPSCTRIGSYAFSRCSNLTTLSFPACISISNSAFASCSGLESIDFPACISIGEYAF